jgi:hypothetical protein
MGIAGGWHAKRHNIAAAVKKSRAADESDNVTGYGRACAVRFAKP